MSGKNKAQFSPNPLRYTPSVAFLKNSSSFSSCVACRPLTSLSYQYAWASINQYECCSSAVDGINQTSFPLHYSDLLPWRPFRKPCKYFNTKLHDWVYILSFYEIVLNPHIKTVTARKMPPASVAKSSQKSRQQCVSSGNMMVNCSSSCREHSELFAWVMEDRSLFLFELFWRAAAWCPRKCSPASKLHSSGTHCVLSCSMCICLWEASWEVLVEPCFISSVSGFTLTAANAKVNWFLGRAFGFSC